MASAEAEHCPPETCNCLPELEDGNFSPTLFVEGDRLYEAIRDSIEAAHNSISIETFILAADPIGWPFVRALAQKASDGVNVRLLVDSAGSMFWVNQEFISFVEQSGIDLRWFRRWSWRRPFQYNRRNHRKLIVVDRQTAFLGGFNIHQENSQREHGPARIRDTHVAVTGSLASHAEREFDAVWENDKDYVDDPTDQGNAVLVSNIFRNCRRRFHCLYQDVLSQATRYAYLTTPYFVPDRRTQRALQGAAERGVDVQLLLPVKRDSPATYLAAHAAYAPLLRSGVRIFEYGQRPLHAKTAVIDDKWGIVGSANLDYRSFFVNYENSILVANTQFASELKASFQDDADLSKEIVEREWARRGWLSRFSEAVGWLGRRWL